MTQTNRITEGVLWKEILLFFVPILIGSFFQHMYSIADTIVVGRGLGTLELAAVGGSASKVIILITNFFIGVSSGITAYASRYYGKQDFTAVKSTIFNGVLFFSALGIILSVLGIVFCEEILLVMNTPLDTMDFSMVYLQTYLTGIIFCVIYNTLAGVLRALGDAKRPLYVLIFCSFLNIALDILLALVLDFGVFGIAAATVFSQALSAFILFGIIIKTLRNTGEYKMQVDMTTMKDIALLGIPAGIQSIMFSFSNIAVQASVNTFNALTVAAWVAYLRIDGIVDMFLSAVSGTVITFVGQNYGAGKMDRVKESIWSVIGISYVLVSLLIAVFILAREPIFSLFTTDAEVIRIAGELMFIILPMYLLTIPQQMLSQASRGLGSSFMPMVFTLICIVGMRFVWVYLIMPIQPSLELLAFCYPVSALLASCVFVVYFRKLIREVEAKMPVA